MRGINSSTDAYRHMLLHKRFFEGGGLIEDLSQRGATPIVNSLSHKDYFEKYLSEGEAFDCLVSAIRVICANEKPGFPITVSGATIPYLSGVNAWSQAHVKDNMNEIIVLFEKFPPAGTTSADGGVAMQRRGGSATVNGHFMLLWRFPSSFKKKEDTTNKFCLFDPFGRKRKDDPEEYYYQKAKGHDFQYPDSDTCALWCVFALLQYCLQIARIQNIEPVAYSGEPAAFNNPDFISSFHHDWLRNEHALYLYLIKNYTIFQPDQLKARPLY